jgi:uncharacterized protein
VHPVRLIVVASLCAAGLTPPGSASMALAQTGAAAARAHGPAPGAPLLWRIEGPAPVYLFGTIHVPDERVLALAPAVEQALAAAESLYTEIPMDAATQVGVMGKVLLPANQQLADVIGAPLADRLGKAVARALPASAPAGTAGMLTAMLSRMKPWAAMSQLSLLEFIPDLAAGRQPLDAMLWSRAQKAGKTVAALETVDEQLAVFDSFSMAEQTRMLELTLDELDRAAQAGGRSQTQDLIEAYLSGDLARLSKAMNDAMEGDRALMQRFIAVALDQRNAIMAERIERIRREQPKAVLFFAVGAAHYAGPTGIVARLERGGAKVVRVK